jgi:hypothetical protein
MPSLELAQNRPRMVPQRVCQRVYERVRRRVWRIKSKSKSKGKSKNKRKSRNRNLCPNQEANQSRSRLLPFCLIHPLLHCRLKGVATTSYLKPNWGNMKTPTRESTSSAS